MAGSANIVVCSSKKASSWASKCCLAQETDCAQYRRFVSRLVILFTTQQTVRRARTSTHIKYHHRHNHHHHNHNHHHHNHHEQCRITPNCLFINPSPAVVSRHFNAQSGVSWSCASFSIVLYSFVFSVPPLPTSSHKIKCPNK